MFSKSESHSVSICSNTSVNDTKNNSSSIMRYLVSSIFTALKTVLFIYIFLPVAFFWGDRWLLQELTFLNDVSWSRHLYPDKCDVHKFFPSKVGAKNYDLQHVGYDGKLGDLIPLWEVPIDDSTKISENDAPIAIYAHGNAFDRCLDNRYQSRIGDYRVLNDFGFNVITFDYGGFSNSTMDTKTTTMNDLSLARDLADVVEYVKVTYKKRKIVIVAHSLGTAVTSVMLDQFEYLKHYINGVVYLGAFDSYQKMISNGDRSAKVFSKIYGERFTNYVRSMSKFHQVGNEFESARIYRTMDEKLPFPIFVTHAVDDGVVPCESHGGHWIWGMSQNLHDITYLELPEDAGCGHSQILKKCKDLIQKDFKNQIINKL